MVVGILVLALYLYVFGGGPPEAHVRVIVPAGYQGVIQIIEDGTDGGGYRKLEGRHEFVIPSSGVLHVRPTKLMQHWLHFEMFDANGERIRFISGAYNDAGLVAENLGTYVEDGKPPATRWVVGSRDYYLRFMKWHLAGEEGTPPTTAPATTQQAGATP